MRLLYGLGGLLLFLAALGLAIKNSAPVTVQYYLGYVWQAPLILVILIAFFVGVVAGVAAAIGLVFRQRREILGLKRELRNRTPRQEEIIPVVD